jgi:hypothetical protein
MCVRNAVLAAWTTLEMACRDALGIPKLKQDFRRSLDEEFAKRNIPPLEFGTGLWGRVNSKVKAIRKGYAHEGVQLSDRFPHIAIAEEAIKDIRSAIHDIYQRLGKESPEWVNFDFSSGWPKNDGMGFPTVIMENADKNDVKTFRIALVTESGEEKATNYFPGTTPLEDIDEKVENIVGSLNVPFSGIRVYQGPTLIDSDDFEMRG